MDNMIAFTVAFLGAVADFLAAEPIFCLFCLICFCVIIKIFMELMNFMYERRL